MDKKAAFPTVSRPIAPGVAVCVHRVVDGVVQPVRGRRWGGPARQHCDADRGADFGGANSGDRGYRIFARRKRGCNARAGAAPRGCRLRAHHVAPASANGGQHAAHDGRLETWRLPSSPPLSFARFVQVVRRAALPTDAAVLLYIQIYCDETIALPSAPGLAITIPSVDVFPNANYYLALYNPTRPSLGWQYGFEGPGNLSGTTVTFASNPSPFTFEAALSSIPLCSSSRRTARSRRRRPPRRRPACRPKIHLR